MNFDKRVWKTGVLAIAVTIVFSILVFSAAEWSRALNEAIDWFR